MRKDYTLLYTDVVDSTAVNTRLGDTGMAALWDEHDRRSRELLRQWHGIEIDRSDGFLVLFDDPPDALGFVDAYHRMLKTLPVQAGARTCPAKCSWAPRPSRWWASPRPMPRV